MAVTTTECKHNQGNFRNKQRRWRGNAWWWYFDCDDCGSEGVPYRKLNQRELRKFDLD